MDTPKQPHKTSDTVIILCYSFCIGQFLVTLVYLNFYCKPLTQLHVAMVGLSAICGILLSGIIRRSYKALRDYWDKKEIKREVAEIVSKITKRDT